MPLHGALSGAVLALAAVPRPLTGMVTSVPTSALPARTSAANMQYGYGGQQGYGQGYGQQSYGQQGYGGAQVCWRLYPATHGVTGHSRFTGAAGSGVQQKYSILPYTIVPGDEQVLGRWNMVQPSPYVSRVQCTVQVGPDGTAYLISHGKPHTMVRRNGQAITLFRGQSQVLANGDQVCIDVKNPDYTVFTVAAESGVQQGGYQQQGGYPQQQGYGQQGGYPQQGGYGY